MENPHERFMRIYPKRLRNASEAVRTLGKLAHPYTYEATEDDWAKIIGRLREDLGELEEAARAQVISAQRRAQRAKDEEGVPEERGFSVERRNTLEQPWSVKT